MNSALSTINAAAIVMTSIVATYTPTSGDRHQVTDEYVTPSIESKRGYSSLTPATQSKSQYVEATRSDLHGIDDSATHGPQIDLGSLVESNVLVLPAALEINLATTHDAAIDLDTLDVVVRRGIFRRNITDLVREHASVLMADRILLALEGETAIPTGQYRVYVSVSDTLGRSVRERFDIRIEAS